MNNFFQKLDRTQTALIIIGWSLAKVQNLCQLKIQDASRLTRTLWAKYLKFVFSEPYESKLVPNDMQIFLIHQKSNMATTAEQSTFYIYTFMLQDLGVLVWDNVEKRVMVVTRYGHDDVKRFWKRQRQANS